jgi:hypothetical protein
VVLPTPAVPDTAQIGTATGSGPASAVSSSASSAVRPANVAPADGSCAGRTVGEPADESSRPSWASS